MRIHISESSINTLTEIQANTPVDISTMYGMLIKKIVLRLNMGDPPAAAPAADALVKTAATCALSTRNGETTIPALGDPGVLAINEVSQWERSQSADGGNAMAFHGERYVPWDFPAGGLAVSDRTLSLYVVSYGVTTTSTASAMLMYELVKMDALKYMAALSVMETM